MAGARPACWVLSDGTAGMEAQAVGLARAAGLDYAVKKIAPSRPLRLAPALGRLPGVPPAAGGDPLGPPWPFVSISCGRRHAGAAIALKRRSGGRVFAVHIQDPRVPPRHFDLLVVPEHDRARGPNVATTTGSLHGIDDAALARAAAAAAPALAGLPRPLVAVCVGGDTREYTVGPAKAGEVAARLAALADRHGRGLAIACSRRTGPALRDALAGLRGRPDIAVWTGPADGPNPWPGILALAERAVVTSDSVNLASEACATGKPVHVLELGPEPRRRAAFHAALRAAGRTRPFDGSLEDWSSPPLRETARVAAILRARLRAAGIEV